MTERKFDVLKMSGTPSKADADRQRTDRELLELAAKAAGITPDKSSTNGGGAGNTGFDILGNLVLDWHDGITWNPLDDDGDALRLAVKLNIDIRFESVADGVSVTAQGAWDGAPPPVFEIFESDGLRSARRAIVRAAAMAEGGNENE